MRPFVHNTLIFTIGLVLKTPSSFTDAWVTISPLSSLISSSLRRIPSLHAYKNLCSISQALQQYQQDPASIHFIDASWYHKGLAKNKGRRDFLQGPRLPRADYWDIEQLTNNDMGKTMFPSRSLVRAILATLSLSSSSYLPNATKTIVLYAREGAPFATTKVWYALRKCSTSSVQILQGSLEDWQQHGGPVDTHPLPESDLLDQQERVRSAIRAANNNEVDDDLLSLTIFNQTQVWQHFRQMTVVDTRGAANFDRGHIPGSKHLHYGRLTEATSPNRFLPVSDMQQVLEDVLLQPSDIPVLLTCGSGVSVCHLALAMDECGYPEPYIYDGSWNEWGRDETTPKETSN